MVVEIALTVRQTDQNHLTLDHLTLDRQTDCRMTWEIFALLPFYKNRSGPLYQAIFARR